MTDGRGQGDSQHRGKRGDHVNDIQIIDSEQKPGVLVRQDGRDGQSQDSGKQHEIEEFAQYAATRSGGQHATQLSISHQRALSNSNQKKLTIFSIN